MSPELEKIDSLQALEDAVRHVRRPVTISRELREKLLGESGAGTAHADDPEETEGLSRDGEVFLPALRLENLGDASFCRDLGIRYPYLAGSMAGGIGSCELVEAMAHAKLLGFFGAGGLPLPQIEAAVDRLQNSLPEGNFGFNLIHSPHETGLEEATVDLYLRRGVRLIEASAFLGLTLPLVRYSVAGIHRVQTGDGQEVVAPNHVIAKVSRVEVASKMFAPPPEKMLRELIARGDITEEQAQMAAEIPVARDLTAEADSGGHTDNRPALSLLPTMLALRDRLQAQYNYRRPLRVGAAGGIATPASATAAFAMGAAYVMTGSVNQACVESGSSDTVRQMLAEARQADVTMAPAADMFEMGVKVQVLKRGTMFAMRAAKLWEFYRANEGLHTIAPTDRDMLENKIFKAPLEEIWNQTRQFFLDTDPPQVERAERDPKHKMALVFRWYLGKSPRWANAGEPDRKIDYQIWCGPGMGAFNEWTKGSFLEGVENRRVVTVAMNILYGAGLLTRAGCLKNQGLSFGRDFLSAAPLETEKIQEYLS